MKKFALVIMMFFSLMSFAQEKNVPERAKKEFRQFHSGVTPSWNQENGVWYAVFQQDNGIVVKTGFNEEGYFVYELIQIEKKEIPDEVISGLRSKFRNANLKEAYVVKSNTAPEYYRVYVELNGKIHAVDSTPDGKLLREYQLR